MKLISVANNKVTIEFTQRELHLANALIQEGRISFECESTDGQALENGVRSAVILMEDAKSSGNHHVSRQ